MKTRSTRNGVIATRVTRNGKRMVMLEEAKFDRRLRKADEFEPLLPDPLPDGSYPAVEFLRASLALKIVRHRRKLGLSQAELARRASIRPESLNRIELNRVEPSIPRELRQFAKKCSRQGRCPLPEYLRNAMPEPARNNLHDETTQVQ